MNPINPEGEEPYSEFRSEQDSNLLWLEDFRLNLIDSTSSFSYSIGEVEYGVETIYNLIGSVGPKLTSNSRTYNDSIQLQVNNGLLSGERIKTLSSHVFSMMEDYVFQSDKGFLFVDINAEEIGSFAKFHIKLIAADISEPDTSAAYAPFCTEDYFSSSDCYRSAGGNPKLNREILNGGPCNDINDETSAQVEVETAIQHDIPRIIYHGIPGWSMEKAYIRYTNPEPNYILFSYHLIGFSENYNDCNNLILYYVDSHNDLAEIEYYSDRLNCTLCILYDYMESIKPTGKELCDVTIWGDLVPDGTQKFIHWQGTLVFCDAEVVQLQIPLPPQEPTPEPNPEDFLAELSILDLFDND